ncbi:aspartic proteinase nepenthesin-2-like [Silene latifolia]|uniref:aspartic proteinase nepenthesin-2-like n=1 Tax=Silene latifolia TaxID=37657 RepID=UPI003D76F6F0
MVIFLGDPMQAVFGIFDTGSDLVWVQCNNLAGKNKFPHFNQTNSSKYKAIDCRNKKQCKTSYTKDVQCSTIRGDNSCLYNIGYVDGTASRGVMASDIITMKPNMTVIPNFLFGCSIANPEDTPGIIGAGNSIYSMPRQLYPNDAKFSYCISGIVSDINYVRFGIDAKLLGRKVKVLRHGLDPFYYMDVIGMKVDAVDIKVDPSEFAMSRDGETGFMIDSGYEYTSLSKLAFNALKYVLQVNFGAPTKVSDFEICYQFKFPWRTIRKPVIGIKFRDWLFELDPSNVWRKMGNTKFECLLVHRSPELKLSVLGAQQLFDVNIGHDLKNNFLYLQPMKCPTTAF